MEGFNDFFTLIRASRSSSLWRRFSKSRISALRLWARKTTGEGLIYVIKIVYQSQLSKIQNY